MEYTKFIELFSVDLSEVKEIEKGTLNYKNNVQELLIINNGTKEITETKQYFNSDNNLTKDELLKWGYQLFIS